MTVRDVRVVLFVALAVGGAIHFRAPKEPSPPVAYADCDRTTSVFHECGKELSSGLRNTFRIQGHTEPAGARRAKSAGEAVKECVSCATDSVTDAIRKFDGSR
jgi:hypothetical protein